MVEAKRSFFLSANARYFTKDGYLVIENYGYVDIFYIGDGELKETPTSVHSWKQRKHQLELEFQVVENPRPRRFALWSTGSYRLNFLADLTSMEVWIPSDYSHLNDIELNISIRDNLELLSQPRIVKKLQHGYITKIITKIGQSLGRNVYYNITTTNPEFDPYDDEIFRINLSKELKEHYPVFKVKEKSYVLDFIITVITC